MTAFTRSRGKKLKELNGKEFLLQLISKYYQLNGKKIRYDNAQAKQQVGEVMKRNSF